MSLTTGSGPFGRWPAGEFNAPAPDREGLLYFEDSPRRVRARFGGETVVDSRAAKLLHEFRSLPVYWFPEGDVRMDLLEPAGDGEPDEHKGPTRLWTIRAGGRVAERAARTQPDPPPGARFLLGHVAFDFAALDEWLEEDEPIGVHPRDPYHRVDVLATTRHVRVAVDGVVLADSIRGRALFETGLPPRWYLPRDDVRMDLLEPSDSTSRCPYKGTATYFSARVGDRLQEDLAWTYLEPRTEVAPIAGLVCFWNERVDLELDGEPQPRPRTQWSEDG